MSIFVSIFEKITERRAVSVDVRLRYVRIYPVDGLRRCPAAYLHRYTLGNTEMIRQRRERMAQPVYAYVGK